MRCTIDGKRWYIDFKFPGQDCWGYTDYSKKRIKISPKLCGQKRLEIILHEVLHAIFPFLDEDSIVGASKSIARILWRLGYTIEKR